MKTIQLLTLSVLLSVSLTNCKNKPSAADLQLETADKQLNADLEMYTSTWDEIINKGKIDLINDTNFDQHITLISSPKNIVGIKEFKAHYQNYLTAFSNITFTIRDVFGQGDRIVKHWNFRGQHTGEFFGIPPTGKEVNIDGVTLVKMKNGKIVQEQDFVDNLEFMQQLGMIPK